MSEKERLNIIRHIAVLELLFATGIRISELCSIRNCDIDLKEGLILIHGKGSKERLIQIPNKSVLLSLRTYYDSKSLSRNTKYFFTNRLDNRLSEQSVRFMIRKYTSMAGIEEKITPHMFRHTFATMLLEEDVDIRYIQKILGHSSIITTQIYTHVSSNKQRDILDRKNPRNKIKV